METGGQRFSRIAMGLFYVAAGLNHFVNPEIYEHVMPTWLPWPTELVWLSGVAEVVLGGMMWLQQYSRWAAWGIIALLVAVFPANLNMLQHPELTPGVPEWVLWARLPFQAVFIYWAYRHTRSTPA